MRMVGSSMRARVSLTMCPLLWPSHPPVLRRTDLGGGLRGRGILGILSIAGASEL